MQQHFNENYLESNKYPRAIFKGQIEQFKPKCNHFPYYLYINGILTIHGESKKMRLPSSIKIIGKNWKSRPTLI
jgi:polyisoprenoid-binding protein YceI